MQRLVLLAIGGALGAIARYGFTLLAARVCGAGFPWGTLAVNWIGCLLIGMCFAAVEQRSLLGPAGRLFFMTGFLGAFTTFSTFALESIQFARPGAYSLVTVNLLAHNVGGLLLVLLGVWLVRVLL